MYSTLLLKNRQPKNLRWFVFALLVLILYLLGQQDSFLYKGLASCWMWTASLVGLPERLQGFTTDSYAYRLICVTLCIGLVHVYFMDWRKTRIVVVLYGAAFLVSVLFIWMSKGAGQEQRIFYEIAKKLIGAMVSPFLAVMFIPTLHLWNTGENRAEQQE